MKFSTRVDYGVLLVTSLAKRQSESPVSLRTIADEEQLSFLYLEQLAAALKQKGLLVSQRGTKGGYQLAKDPKHLTLGAVVRALDEPRLMRCIHAEGSCPRRGHCDTEPIWRRLQKTLDHAMDQITVAELIADDGAGGAKA